MLQRVDVGERSLARYGGAAPAETLEQLRTVGTRLRRLRVLHVNATPYGGGVAELLRSTIPLLNDIGLVADWKIIGGDKGFFEVTKSIHNGLQGDRRTLDEEERAEYRAASETNAALLDEQYDVVFVHDPQPAAIPLLRGKGTARWIWRCHIDTSAPNQDTWAFIRSYLEVYDAAVFTLERKGSLLRTRGRGLTGLTSRSLSLDGVAVGTFGRQAAPDDCEQLHADDYEDKLQQRQEAVEVDTLVEAVLGDQPRMRGAVGEVEVQIHEDAAERSQRGGGEQQCA